MVVWRFRGPVYGWSGDYVCCDCGYNDSKDAFGERGKNEFVKINKEREGNEKS
ncbi:Eag protein [Escherichia coli]